MGIHLRSVHRTLAKRDPYRWGFSPVTFTLKDGPQYTVLGDNYLTNMFDHWFDTGSKNNSRNISIMTDTSITAVYRTIP